MKYTKILAALIFMACNNQPKEPGTVAYDTTKFEEPKKFAPPLGAQGTAESYGEMPGEGVTMGARAIAPVGTQRVVLKSLDTQTTVTTKKSFPYTVTDVTIQKYNPTPIPPVNKPPVANAGTDKSITLPVNSIQLAGSGADSDGTIVSYAWIKVSGGAATIKTVGAATTVAEGMIQGIYIFQLTVKDNGGLTGSDDVKITVNPVVPPIPIAGYRALPISAPMDLRGKSNMIIENKRFLNSPKYAIDVTNASNIEIRNCFFDGAVDDANGELVNLEDAQNINIHHNLFNGGTAGVYSVSSTTVKVNNNQFVNMRMSAAGSRGQAVQFNGTGGPGCEIMNNMIENFAGESNAEDMISLYGGSRGTASSPIMISGNWGRGGCPSTSGGGIIAGDNNGGYVIMKDNSLMNPGQYGMAIAGGDNIQILNNKIYSDRTDCSNNPLYVWAQQGAPCSNNLVKGNRVNWIDKAGVVNNGWNSGNCSNTIYNPEENTTISKAEMNFPVHLITYVTPAELLLIRK